MSEDNVGLIRIIWNNLQRPAVIGGIIGLLTGGGGTALVGTQFKTCDIPDNVKESLTKLVAIDENDRKQKKIELECNNENELQVKTTIISPQRTDIIANIFKEIKLEKLIVKRITNPQSELKETNRINYKDLPDHAQQQEIFPFWIHVDRFLNNDSSYQVRYIESSEHRETKTEPRRLTEKEFNLYKIKLDSNKNVEKLERIQQINLSNLYKINELSQGFNMNRKRLFLKGEDSEEINPFENNLFFKLEQGYKYYIVGIINQDHQNSTKYSDFIIAEIVPKF